ncbi:hypothetical protein [Escherichia phage Lidtsur]|uniref:Internal virion protein n=1 Tax=Escherichia phage Lidtsur TaxID=2562235 RepID=A0A4D6DZ42_9CAUD|nr:internal virion protein [Escherichia phage Lidtsur]QBZ71548.1 hypothetical protein [Escherichia phage Lidtsur]
MGWAVFAKAGADATNSFITTYAQGRAERAQMKAVQAENERLNKQTWQAMGQRINTVNLQRGLLRQQTGTDLYNIGKEANRAAGASINNAAAAGIEGASVDEAVQDISRQNQESQAATRFNEQIQEMNLDTSIQDIVSTAVAAQRYSQKPASNSQILGRAIGVSSMQFLSSLAQTSFDYMPTEGAKGTGTQGGSGATASTFSNLGSSYSTTNWMQKAGEFDPVPAQYSSNRYTGYSSGSFYGG